MQWCPDSVSPLAVSLLSEECPAQASHHPVNLLNPRQTVREVFPHTAFSGYMTALSLKPKNFVPIEQSQPAV